MFTDSFTKLEKDMKNTLLAIALASAGMFAVPVLSHAADNDNGGWFINQMSFEKVPGVRR